MEKLVLAQKMSGTGSIHDIESEHRERVIYFRKGTLYAVVLASYYGGKGYTCHATEHSAVRQSERLRKMGYSHQIIDLDSIEYVAHGYSLIARDYPGIRAEQKNGN